jgi:hypothetical protein
MSYTRKTQRLVSFIAAAAIVASAPTLAMARSNQASKKKSAAPTEAEAPPAADAATAPAPAPAPPTPGTEAPGPKPLDQAGARTGSLTVKGDKMEIVFNGHSVGAAPVTIGGIPRGDYIVEGTMPDGRKVTRPVTIEDNREFEVDLGMFLAAQATAEQPGDNDHPRLRKASKILLGASAGALVVGLVFGALELKTHGEYESAPANQATLDSLSRTGKREALIANLGFAACGATLLAAGLTALPIILGSEHPAASPPPVAVTATASGNSAMAGISMRF